MEKIIHRADSRGGGNFDWLSTRHSFSFAQWYDPARMGFGALRVLNDDKVAPASGFGMHAHSDMEIITIVMEGTVTHTDSMGNSFEVPAGDVQVMSAGTGVKHSEENASPSEPLEFFQIWIEPNVQGSAPRYAQKSFGLGDTPGLTTIVGPDETEGALAIQQEAYISHAVVDGDNPLVVTLKDPSHGAYIFVIKGSVSVMDEELEARDAMGISGVSKITLSTKDQSSLLIIEVPLK
ncbi:MAG TPA: pirin family protein [Candidatus Paceibacterota bacterium]|jgi:hypothetical protein